MLELQSPRLSGSVGQGGDNHPDDVRTIQDDEDELVAVIREVKG